MDNSKKILFVILTCNRLFYLKNCMKSIFKFVDQDRIDILICDNCTIEKGSEEYLNNMSKYDNVTIKKYEDRNRNELYRAMNWAIKYAKKNKYNVINFVQDDYQYVSRNDKHLDDVFTIFDKHDDIVQVNCNMGWKRKAKGLGKVKIIKANGTLHGILLKKRATDNGFTRVSAYDKVGEYPVDAISWGHGPDRYKNRVNGEIWFGKECSKRGWRRTLTYLPNITMMFDCAYVRGNERYGRYFEPSGEFYLKQLNDEQISKIKRQHDKHKFAYIEDFCIPDGWEPLTYDKHSPSKKIKVFA